ncbi:hypothetical protein HBI03_220650 [Parastagonospora nodorum]|nr:hypothetical protein HBI03_220650 [Parastagonospora nodorum]
MQVIIFYDQFDNSLSCVTLLNIAFTPEISLCDALSNSSYLLHASFIMGAANIARDDFYMTFKGQLVNGKYSDIACHGDTYNAHQAIACSRSGFFERADRFPGKEHKKVRLISVRKILELSSP